ncbi:MAG TPA: CBS domain-containing protein [Chloroflexota bacterium]|nr:CBS domain-containing protein [Chloroflexota bacterium]
MKVYEIMSSPAISVKTTATVQFAAEMMATHNVGALPVTQDGVLVGIVTDRDVVLRALAPGRSPTATEVHEIMSTAPIALEAGTDVAEAARVFTDTRIRRLPIVEDGHPVGMVTVDDIARLWDDDRAILLMVRRVAPRRKRHSSAA